MPVTIEIRDRDPEGGALQFDLADLLAVVEDQGRDLRWFILEIEAVGVVRDLDLGALPNRLRGAEDGLRVSWQRLVQIGQQLEQTINCLIVGCAEDDPSPRRSGTGVASTSECSLVIEAVDSTFWRVTTRLSGVADALRIRFRDLIEV